MAEKVWPLRQAIFGKYKNVTKAAEAMGWKEKKLHRIVNGEQEPKVSDVAELAKELDLDVGTVIGFFTEEEK